VRIVRFLRHVLARDEVARGYPDRAIQVLWNAFGRPAQSRRTAQAVGKRIHRRACRIQDREPLSAYTRFFRNPPQLEVLREAALEMNPGASLRLAVLGCSAGAELYSALWTIRTTRPDLTVSAVGVDISKTCIQAAIDGTYPLSARTVEGIAATTYERLFTPEGDLLRVQDWLREGVSWKIADACSLALRHELGLQDVVLANNYLCHMLDEHAEICLRNAARMVAPDGYLFVWGVDLAIRARVVRAMGLKPVTARIEEIYLADRAAREAWPLKYWGIEPLDKERSDWMVRYATVYRRLGDMGACGVSRMEHAA